MDAKTFTLATALELASLQLTFHCEADNSRGRTQPPGPSDGTDIRSIQ